ncbi:MAG: cytidine deaminase [Intestinibacter sp.]|uniref:cytidine deaminase n=1 Tax=Intestinibacter sp. TaxID=1965304 RepID=UPI003F144159
MDSRELLKLAEGARLNAYVPYSKFRVGAALLTSDGKVYTGCNIESASFGATNCAERTAIFKAISEGERKFVKLAVASDNSEKNQPTWPCGICRQVIVEFADDMQIITGSSKGDIIEINIKDLLPHYFAKGDF